MNVTELRKTGIEILGDTPWGSHFCHFYETKEDLLDCLVPYFKAALENNEFSVWVLFEPVTEEDAKTALRAAVPDVDRRIEAGDIELISYAEWYLEGGSFDLTRVVNSLRHKLSAALAKGYDGMRVNGNEAWVTNEDWRDFTEYEDR